MKTLPRSRFLFLPVVCLISVGACEWFNPVTPKSEKKRVEKEIGYGKIVGNTYTNDYFNLKVTVPEGWHLLTKAEQKEVRKEVSREFSDDSKDKTSRFAQARTLILLTIAKQRLRIKTPGTFNDNITIGAERIAHAKSMIKNGKEYLDIQIQSLKKSKFQVLHYNIEDGFRIGAIPAYRLKADISLQKLKTEMLTYCAIIDDYAFFVSLNYSSRDGLKELEAIFNSIEASL